VLLEERAESVIQQWRSSQRVALKVHTDEELEWELERKSVHCKALIDAKLEELFGPQEGTSDAGAGAVAQMRKELREREKARVERTRKRKAWHESEFASLLKKVESEEKRLRTTEKEKDEADRKREEAEGKDKEADGKDKGPDPVAALNNMADADSKQLVEMIDRIQSESREDSFKVPMDVTYFRNEKTFETKLRPWLERKVDLFMGGSQSDLVEYILRRVNAAVTPESLISDLGRYLDDNAEPLVERMWRMLIFELLCNNNLSVPGMFALKEKKGSTGK
jgi:hypothetical protein